MASMNSIRDTFFEECEELLEALGEGLALMAEGAHDGETVNAVFRAVHSIKGGAGAFALNALVAFAHRFETVLDGLRSDRIELTADVMHTLLRSADHLADQVEAARDGAEVDPETTAGFLANLDALLGGPAEPETAVEDDPCFGFSALPLDFGADLAEPAPAAGDAPSYTIRFRPLPSLYANGHDPALILMALADLGQVEVTLDLSALPDWAAFDPAGSYLAWTIRLTTAEPETVLHEVFEFVEGHCALEILPDAARALPPPPWRRLPCPSLPNPFCRSRLWWPRPRRPRPSAPRPAPPARGQGRRGRRRRRPWPEADAAGGP